MKTCIQPAACSVCGAQAPLLLGSARARHRVLCGHGWERTLSGWHCPAHATPAPIRPIRALLAAAARWEH